ncbi:hypothetical protein MML48_4g00011937 [Holotrichia oblita]|uniref:Uncharacterized protein n=1 Tax=Holotrichia oblita TaxID=644536 RepID=A0ACB9T9T4_HOLOL|nr:hypothetical protein MML48_4g00011937 [Holotrichia oblita]
MLKAIANILDISSILAVQTHCTDLGSMSVNEKVARSVALEQAYVHDVYELFCDNPKSKPWPRVQHFLETLEPGSLVCDVGCGNGKYLNINSTIFNMGGDKCIRLSEIAREKDNEVLVFDNLSLPFRDESLDAVLSIAVVHHFATTERRVCALRELARVLRIGGRLIISVWAMEQSHRKFESQDVLVPWHRSQHLTNTPSVDLTSTTNTSEDDAPPHYHAYSQSDTDSYKSNGKSKFGSKKRGKTRNRGRSIDPKKNSSPSSSSLSSPNETCYSFVRRAIQKLAGTGKRVGVHRPWFLDSWTNCTKEVPPKRYDPDGCEQCFCENVQDIPIELRRVDDDDVPQRRQTFPSSLIFNDVYSNLKSRSMTNIKTADGNEITRSKSNIHNIIDSKTEIVPETTILPNNNKISTINTLNKPKLVKQKKSICEEDADEALDEPTEMKQVSNHTEIRSMSTRRNVFKQRSLNEELMSTDRLQEKEKVRQNIQKQTSLNEDLICPRHHTFDSIKDSLFSASTAKKLHLIKTGFTKKIKNSTTNIEKVAGGSLKNGFVKMFQNWTSSELISPTIPEDDNLLTPKKSDTSVDSEDSFASVIFVPKCDPISPSLSPGPTSPRLSTSSVPNSPRIKQSSCPTSPRIKQMPLSVYPLTKQLSSPKPTISKFSEVTSPTDINNKSNKNDVSSNKSHEPVKDKKFIESLAKKYAVQQIPKFKKTPLNSGEKEVEKNGQSQKNKEETLKEIRELLSKKANFGMKSTRANFPIVRRASVSNGKSIAKPLPKLLCLELFNPETDDKDSDSSAVSSPDSVDSVISISQEKSPTTTKSPNSSKFSFSENETENSKSKTTLLEAAAEVANSLDEAVDKVIKSSPRARRREIKTGEVISVMQRQYSSETTPLLSDVEIENSWNDECHKHLTDFADRLSEKLLQEIDQYQEQTKKSYQHHINDDPYINRLSQELSDLSKLSRSPSINTLKTGTSIESCDSDKGSSPPTSMLSSITTSLNFGHSMELSEGCSDKGSIERDTNSMMSRYSGDGGSTASLVSCPEWKHFKTNGRSSSDHSRMSLDSSDKNTKTTPGGLMHPSSYSDTSQESLPSDNIGGEITYHRYYHVFREGELDQLIEKYVENLHIISSYYDHASWCIIAEKVQVWTI